MDSNADFGALLDADRLGHSTAADWQAEIERLRALQEKRPTFERHMQLDHADEDGRRRPAARAGAAMTVTDPAKDQLDELARHEQIEYVRERIAEAIAARMILGLTYEQATAEAFAYCNRRWPHLVAALRAS